MRTPGLLLLLALALAAMAQDDVPELRRKSATLVAQGSYAEAESLLARTVELQEQQSGPEDPRLAPLLDSLGAVSRAQGRNADAAKSYLRSLAIREKASGAAAGELRRNPAHLLIPEAA
jgi:Tetratricopeptide repeat